MGLASLGALCTRDSATITVAQIKSNSYYRLPTTLSKFTPCPRPSTRQHCLRSSCIVCVVIMVNKIITIRSSAQLKSKENIIFSLLNEDIHVHIVHAIHPQQCLSSEVDQATFFGNHHPSMKVISIDPNMLYELRIVSQVLSQHYAEGLSFFCPLCGVQTE